MSGARGEMPASQPGLYSPEQKYSITVSAGNRLPWANPGGTQIPFAVRFVAPNRHVVGDRLAVGRRAFADVEHEIDHLAADGADKLAHERVPLEVHPADRAHSGKAFVGLQPADAMKNGVCSPSKSLWRNCSVK